MFGFKIIRQYEQGIVFRFGRAIPGVRKPGLIWINPFTSRLTKVNMQIAVVGVPAQETRPDRTADVAGDAVRPVFGYLTPHVPPGKLPNAACTPARAWAYA